MITEKEFHEAIDRYSTGTGVGSAYWKSDPINGQYWDEEQSDADAHTIASYVIEKNSAQPHP